jgi:hypothetical protein
MATKFPDIGPCEVCHLPVDSGKHVQLKGLYPDRALYYHTGCMEREAAKRDAANKLPPKRLDRPLTDAEEIFTPKQAAAFLQISRTTLAKLKAPSHPLPGTNRRRYLKSELVEWVRTANEMATGLTVILH